MDNIKLDGIPTKIKWKIHTLFPLYFNFWRYFLSKFIRCSHQFLSLFLSFYHNFLELLKKDFCHKFHYFNGLAPTPDSLNSQNPLSITEVYCLCCFRSFIFIVVPQKSKILKLLELKLILRVLKKWRPMYIEAIWKC